MPRHLTLSWLPSGTDDGIRIQQQRRLVAKRRGRGLLEHWDGQRGAVTEPFGADSVVSALHPRAGRTPGRRRLFATQA
jgi:hypothetical protein